MGQPVDLECRLGALDLEVSAMARIDVEIIRADDLSET